MTRKTRYAALLAGGAALLLTATAANAAANAKSMMDAHGCFACHSVTNKIVGPAFGWVAYHFKGKPGAVNTLADFIIKGGTGYWKPWTGTFPMPAHPGISHAQAETIAKWVLSRKPIKPPAP